eukprot:COSAG02_NODE_49626_length_325_cov_1.323009_1_plen_87_part_10
MRREHVWARFWAANLGSVPGPSSFLNSSRVCIRIPCDSDWLSPSGSTQRGTAPDLSLLRFRRPFADTDGDLSLSTSESHSTYNFRLI